MNMEEKLEQLKTLEKAGWIELLRIGRIFLNILQRFKNLIN